MFVGVKVEIIFASILFLISHSKVYFMGIFHNKSIDSAVFSSFDPTSFLSYVILIKDNTKLYTTKQIVCSYRKHKLFFCPVLILIQYLLGNILAVKVSDFITNKLSPFYTFSLLLSGQCLFSLYFILLG